MASVSPDTLVNNFEIEYTPPPKDMAKNKSYVATANVIASYSPNLSGDSGFGGSPSPLGQAHIGASMAELSVQPDPVALNVTSINVAPSLIASAQSIASEKCLRCSSLVYALERIGPIRGNIYHKTCFKCHNCERQLDLKTYYTNQVNLSDKQIYCQSHAPKSGKGVFGADSIYIHNVLNAPKLDVMQKCDNKPKVILNVKTKCVSLAKIGLK
ncbi:kyphoscoliosis peptidase-like [Brachionus plicatilis]|uniref:Kyphoscoliosis peptidase-like n=1 Tax=Brachionus plicatilis TaxID=10195 RepID=A0A3M7S5D7_BRAPC|nr:kyphoscoliosis peptidase-like [Brachionus plicatilis]